MYVHVLMYKNIPEDEYMKTTYLPTVNNDM